MLVLALDTTTRSGSIALARFETTGPTATETPRVGHATGEKPALQQPGHADVLGVVTGDPARTHAERLPGDILRLLGSHGLELDAVDLFAVAAGPGSFTGLRIGIATVQGLAFALNRPVAAISCLDALAHVGVEAGGPPAALVGAFMDAQRSEVFASLYEVRQEPGGSALHEVDGPVSQPPAVVLARWRETAADRTVRMAGDGVARYRSMLDEQFRVVEPLPPLAPMIARLAVAEAAAGRAGAPHAVRPVYVRRPDAELARDKRNS